MVLFDAQDPASLWEWNAALTDLSVQSTARVRTGRFSALHLDDWLTFSCIVWYTLLIVALNKVFFSGGSNFMTPEEEAALTPETTAARIEGSKWVLVVEEAMVLTVWTCKLGMLFLYRRITYVDSLFYIT